MLYEKSRLIGVAGAIWRWRNYSGRHREREHQLQPDTVTMLKQQKKTNQHKNWSIPLSFLFFLFLPLQMPSILHKINGTGQNASRMRAVQIMSHQPSCLIIFSVLG